MAGDYEMPKLKELTVWVHRPWFNKGSSSEEGANETLADDERIVYRDFQTGAILRTLSAAAPSAGNWPASDAGTVLTDNAKDESLEQGIKNFLDGALPKLGQPLLTDDTAVKIGLTLIRIKGGGPKLEYWAADQVYKHVDPRKAKDQEHVRTRIWNALRRKLGTFNKPNRKPKEAKNASFLHQ
jgi:hypothetical protein